MDPVATIVDALTKEYPYRDCYMALRGWYAANGFRPTMLSVMDLYLRRTGKELTKALQAKARAMGAVAG